MRRLLVLCSLLALAGCDSRPAITLPGEEIDLCATINRQHFVQLVRSDGSPATGLQARSIVLTTGELIGATTGDEQGLYLVTDDGDQAAFADGSRIVRFTATGSESRAEADFVFAFDGCHVTKESGPAEITVRASL